MQLVPRWAGNEARIRAAYLECLERTGPAVVLAHSQGGAFAFEAALERPDLVKALILIEPGGVPSDRDLAPLAKVPILSVWGDYVAEVPFWAEASRSVGTALDHVSALGGEVEQIHLPRRGIAGNSHLLMMDSNSDEIAALVPRLDGAQARLIARPSGRAGREKPKPVDGAAGQTSSHSCRTLSASARSAGDPSKTTRPCPMT